MVAAEARLVKVGLGRQPGGFGRRKIPSFRGLQKGRLVARDSDPPRHEDGLVEGGV